MRLYSAVTTLPEAHSGTLLRLLSHHLLAQSNVTWTLASCLVCLVLSPSRLLSLRPARAIGAHAASSHIGGEGDE